jgi:regulator of sirC expression with transglutaminase-like and TPR domain
MKKFFFFLLSSCFLFAEDLSYQAIYKSLKPDSLSEQIAFYHLYPGSEEGKKALKQAWKLLTKDASNVEIQKVLPNLDPQFLLTFITKKSMTKPQDLSENQIALIEELSKHFKNRNLKGHLIWSEKKQLELPLDEIDLSRGLLVAQWGESKESQKKILAYEAYLDLMALHIQAKLPKNYSDLELIYAINELIFHEMHFHYPAHSNCCKQIDAYTFLSSVIESRQGVCLGVSILYLSLAQRLGLSLEAITPPGHIYVHYMPKDINIETTARGIDVPSEHYLNIETRKLQRRNLREVIGLAFMNEAAISWTKSHYAEAITLYEKAAHYMGEDPSLKEFLSYNYLMVGQKEKAKKLLQEIAPLSSEYEVEKNDIAEDYLQGRIDEEGIQVTYIPTDPKRTSIIEKQKKLEKVLQKHPKFRAGLLQLSNLWLELGREKEALRYLLAYEKVDPESPIVNYYLSAIFLDRYNYPKAWEYYHKVAALLQKKKHSPKALKDLHETLKRTFPDPYS